MAAASQPYLPHINGLRGIAILAVFLYHLNSNLCPCGYFGVDVFLVISGYFLYRNDVPKLLSGQQSPRQYAARKLWRIVPPWLCIALPVVLCCVMTMVHDRNITIAGTVGATAFGFANDYVAFSGSYFNPNVQQNPLMHLWYIGLTEQIYLLLPLLSVFACRWAKGRYRTVVLSLAALVSFLCYVFLNFGQLISGCQEIVQELNQEWVRPYYSVITRFWEPLLGALLVPVAGYVSPRYNGTLAALALAALVGSMYYADTGSACNMLAVVAACVLLSCGQRGPVARLLNSRPLQLLGILSFSLYLVHWPVMVLWQYACMWQPEAGDMIGMALLSLPLAWLLYHFVESRCGAWQKSWSRRRKLVLGVGTHGVVAAWAVSMTQFNFMDAILPSAVPQSVSGYRHMLLPTAPEQRNATRLTDAFPGGVLQLGKLQQQPVRFLLLGDSHAWHLCDGLSRACNEAGTLRGLYLNTSCMPAWDCRMVFSQGSAL